MNTYITEADEAVTKVLGEFTALEENRKYLRSQIKTVENDIKRFKKEGALFESELNETQRKSAAIAATLTTDENQLDSAKKELQTEMTDVLSAAELKEQEKAQSDLDKLKRQYIDLQRARAAVCMYVCMYVCTYVCMYCMYVCVCRMSYRKYLVRTKQDEYRRAARNISAYVMQNSFDTVTSTFNLSLPKALHVV